MKTRLVIDEDSVYEIDEECEKARRERERRPPERRGRKNGYAGTDGRREK